MAWGTNTCQMDGVAIRTPKKNENSIPSALNIQYICKLEVFFLLCTWYLLKMELLLASKKNMLLFDVLKKNPHGLTSGWQNWWKVEVVFFSSWEPKETPPPPQSTYHPQEIAGVPYDQGL